MSLEPIRLVGLVYCVDAKQLESAVDLGMIDDCVDVKDLSENKLHAFLSKEAVDSATVVTESDLSAMVLKHVRMDMSVKSTTVRMKLLFIDYKLLLRQHGMAWVAEKNQKPAVRHVLLVVKQAKLKNRLEQDISFPKRHLKKHLSAFL
ncbi:hypothetical protein BWQ96_08528 [Gracilariopsis chorda]|uniref:Uncharacterized protein n=1 Tax=Gracilariopsis chorda TaxID=448386 RepID=A0A2V3II55_9FLOR|nr:hypothetical protein BWQ96_08528 [Gracilariopsis chorda]|eukprot:PXF41739.1 hypothetical protein BWQ96_08528 [Gracilariopsis chorda]